MYKNYTDKELITALAQLEKLIYTRKLMGDDICEVNKTHYIMILAEIKKRGENETTSN